MRPYILLTNDDGIYSPGLLAAARAAAPLGDLLIAAPATQQTAMGRAFPRESDTGIIREVELGIGIPHKAYCVSGSPAWCVAYAVLELAERPVDLCIAGINYGENMGMVISCSGTVGAAFEAVSHGIPCIAVSLETDPSVYRSADYSEQDWTCAERSLAYWAEWMLKKGEERPADILNINVPAAQVDPRQYRITTQSRQTYLKFAKPPARDFTKPYAILSHRLVDEESLEADSDIRAVRCDRVISVTPMTGRMECGWNKAFRADALPEAETAV